MEHERLDKLKLMSVATDGAPATRSEKVGLVDLHKKIKLKRLGVSTFAIHCFLHQETLLREKVAKEKHY